MSLFTVDSLWNSAQIKAFVAEMPLPVFVDSARSERDREAVGYGFHVWTGIDLRYGAIDRLMAEEQADRRALDYLRFVRSRQRTLTWPIGPLGGSRNVASRRDGAT